MTRDQIKEVIIKILKDPVIVLAETKAERIMKLWDKGFTYDLPKKKE